MTTVKPESFDDQKELWERSYAGDREFFGPEESIPARWAAEAFRKDGAERILDLGCGQGRDTLFFARRGFFVTAADYSAAALKTLSEEAAARGTASRICTAEADVRKPLPFGDGSFDGCYSHMLFCMALTLKELLFLSSEIRRVLVPRGLNIYTVRHKGDVHWKKGTGRGEDIRELDGYAVRFFDRQTVALLATGFSLEEVEEFEEGDLPRKLFYVVERRLEIPVQGPVA
ncbi:class I SAM-dependent methyltransferase [Aminivibrio sp.]|jgi:SAM-dependent methyltransferase|uniref:class I SAM-dependent methyltransferase n=1 Tax=Aminivibrio sp. TaxID=1872489 RepID=UPI001A609031|nr:class I SAM-dependent methyltransferase [Aminivibrio sp.]MBL3538997.1 class I SAM-dependent methyltransferase [Aminivibrio sp.]MDK2958911.1 hypothetical protein [Synergistaceae bacterium]